MTKEELLESYLTNLSKKLNELDFQSEDKDQVAQQALEITLQMRNRLNTHFQEHFIDDLTDDEIAIYFESVKKGTDQLIVSLPINILD